MTRPRLRWTYLTPTLRLPRHLVLATDEELVDVLTLEVRISRRCAAEQRGPRWRARRRQEVERIRVEVVAEAGQLAAERADVDVERDALVEPAPVAVNLAAAVPA